MLNSWVASSLTLALSVLSTTAAVSLEQVVAIRRHTPAQPASDPHWELIRALEEAQLYKRDTLRGNTTIDRTWEGVTLLKFDVARINQTTKLPVKGTVDVVCTRCYIKGLAKAQLNVPDNLNASSALQQTVKQVNSTVQSITTTVRNELKAFALNATEYVGEMIMDGLDGVPMALPQMNVDFNIAVPAMPQISVDFSFDGLELYMELDTILDGKVSYTYNVATTQSFLGIGHGQDELLGATVTLDLVLTADAAVDMRSGFHLKFEDDLGFNVALFNKTVSKLKHNGGKFEFLPVTIESAGVTLQAILRLSAHVGVIAATAQRVQPINVAGYAIDLGIKSGIETKVFANLVDLSAGIVATPNEVCKLKVFGGYQLGLGAAAGATVEAAGHTWGPHIEAKTAVWTASKTMCAIVGKPTRSTSTTLAKRADTTTIKGMTTTSTALKITYTAVQCQSTTVGGGCPASLQLSTRAVSTTTLTSVVPSGAKASWPKTPGVTNTVATTFPFRGEVVSISATSGPPTTYTAPPNAIDNFIDAVDTSVEQNKKFIIGVAAGVGSAALIIVAIATAYFISRRRKQKYAAVTTDPHMEPTFFPSQSYPVSQKAGVHESGGKQHDSFVQVQEYRQSPVASTTYE